MASFTRFPWDQQPQQQPKYPGISTMPGGPSSLSTYTPPPQASAGGFNGADGLAAFAQQLAAQAQQSGNLRLQGQREFTSGRHLGMDGTDVNPSTGRSSGNAFDSGFFKSGASQLTPEALLASQGNNAMNQWAQRGGVQGVNPVELARMNQVRQQQAVYNPPDARTWQTPEQTLSSSGSTLPNKTGGVDLYDSGASRYLPGGQNQSLVGSSDRSPGAFSRGFDTPVITDENGPQLRTRSADFGDTFTGKGQPPFNFDPSGINTANKGYRPSDSLPFPSITGTPNLTSNLPNPSAPYLPKPPVGGFPQFTAPTSPLPSPNISSFTGGPSMPEYMPHAPGQGARPAFTAPSIPFSMAPQGSSQTYDEFSRSPETQRKLESLKNTPAPMLPTQKKLQGIKVLNSKPLDESTRQQAFRFSA